MAGGAAHRRPGLGIWPELLSKRGVPVPDDGEWRSAREAAERSLAEAVAGPQDQYPDVMLRRQLIQGDPVEALLESSRHASLIVVGRHASPHLATLGLGHVARALIGRAKCPVMVALPNPRRHDLRAALAQPVPPWTGY